MLKVFLKPTRPNASLVKFNDAWFDRYFYDLKFDSNMENLISTIDGGKYIGSTRFISKFGNCAISLMSLSTGCKTALNVYSFQDKIFNIAECGGNAIDEIFRLSKGNIYADYYFKQPNISSPVEVHFHDKMHVIGNTEDFASLLNNLFYGGDNYV